MPKENGLDFTIAIDDAAGTPRNIENEVTNMDLTTPRGVIDVTRVNLGRHGRIQLSHRQGLATARRRIMHVVTAVLGTP